MRPALRETLNKTLFKNNSTVKPTENIRYAVLVVYYTKDYPLIK